MLMPERRKPMETAANTGPRISKNDATDLMGLRKGDAKVASEPAPATEKARPK